MTAVFPSQEIHGKINDLILLCDKKRRGWNDLKQRDGRRHEQ